VKQQVVEGKQKIIELKQTINQFRHPFIEAKNQD